MRIIQISDTHISLAQPSRTADLEACVRSINAADPQPDLVVHTGDVAHDGLDEEYAAAKHILDRLRAPYVVMPGNRDRRGALVEAFADSRRIRRGMEFVQYAIDHLEVRLLVLDTHAPDSNKGRLCAARMAGFERMLAADTARPVVVFLHHPPFEVAEIPDPRQFVSWGEAEAFQALVGGEPRIRGVHCGHVHRTIEARIGAVPASTISCVAIDLRKGRSIAPPGSAPMLKVHAY